ncbi:MULTISPECIES: DUF5344 family protein [Heyndrickxia]|uniref:DUF5344 family protein n=1 Tax=Heyndrickxia TaxID=2837504 RepID=UPI000E548B16|nr:DUF5344 family protein [Heyndrickxia coagulans]MED4936141.1 DUF5344 family protein [Heyndrickxia coagulans]MED4941758.1 DUF5344 family protein [Heyndrickxia coagulans]RGR83781.1 hypothetical protein DWY22_09580 [Heyndrickxia coagulans]RGR97510.1 hypothetical protein DWY16_10575 [Heyndrickxia coagulans]
MEVKIQFESVEKSLAKIRSQAQNLDISMDGRGSYPLPSLQQLAYLNQKLENLLTAYQAVTLKNEAAAKKAVHAMKEYDEQLEKGFEGRAMSR